MDENYYPVYFPTLFEFICRLNVWGFFVHSWRLNNFKAMYINCSRLTLNCNVLFFFFRYVLTHEHFLLRFFIALSCTLFLSFLLRSSNVINFSLVQCKLHFGFTCLLWPFIHVYVPMHLNRSFENVLFLI